MKAVIKKMPGVKQLYNKFKNLNDSICMLKDENFIIARENIDLRLQLKKLMNEKINVVFICHRPTVWASLKSVYDELKANDKFNVSVIVIPMKVTLPGLGYNHENYEWEGACEYWKDYNCIKGYDDETKKWFDIKSLKPDYVFYQQPYNVMRCDSYKSEAVSKYAKICYVSYFATMNINDELIECTPMDFLGDLSFYFTQNDIDHEFMKARIEDAGKGHSQTLLTGFPRYDDMEQYNDCDDDIWNLKKNEAFRVIWTPRWTTNEGNCHFFDYKDKVIQYCDNNKDIDFIFRPHPQSFIEWNTTGELTVEQAQGYKAEYEMRNNMKIDYSKEYISTFASSDCMITDPSSVIAEYFLTGKPIIYCDSDYPVDGFTKEITEGFYHVKSWEEVINVIERLKNGEDPLYEKRQELIKKAFYIGFGSAGKKIADIIYEDATKSL